MSDYYVRRTGDNSDYLEHAAISGSGSGGRTNWKYLAKMMIGGKMRYFYDQASLAAARAGGAVSRVRRSITNSGLYNRAKGAFDRATGLSARRAMNVNRARAESLRPGRKRALARNNAKRYENAYNRSIAGRLENFGNAARNAIGSAASTARKKGQSFAGSVSKEAYKVGNKVKRKVGLTSLERMNKLNNKLSTARLQGKKALQRGRANSDYANAIKNTKSAYDRANKYYRENTLLGRGQQAIDDAQDWIKETKKKRKAKKFQKYLNSQPKGRA